MSFSDHNFQSSGPSSLPISSTQYSHSRVGTSAGGSCRIVDITQGGPRALPTTKVVDEEEDMGNYISVESSPGTTKRGPTFKDYTDHIRKLDREIFQLKLRVWIAEQKVGVPISSSEMTHFILQHLRQGHVESYLKDHNCRLPFNFSAIQTSSSQSHSSPPNRNSTFNQERETSNLTTQLGSLTSHNERLTTTIADLEGRVQKYETALRERQTENDCLAGHNQMLSEKLEEVESKYSSTKIALEEQISNNQVQALSEAEVERGALIAFGGGRMSSAGADESFSTALALQHNRIEELEEQLDQIKSDMEDKVKEEKSKVLELEDQVNRLHKRIAKSREVTNELEVEKKTLEEKVMDCSKVFVDLGRRNVALADQVEQLKKVQEEISNSNLNVESIANDRLDKVRELMSQLQRSMKETVAFVEALFQMESKKIFSILGLKEESRTRLKKSLSRCRNLSNRLDETLQNSPVLAGDKDKRVRFERVHSSPVLNLSYNSHLYEQRAAGGDLDEQNEENPFLLPRKLFSCVEMEVQCDLLVEHDFNTNANLSSLLAKVQEDLRKAETRKNELLSEQGTLHTLIHTLQTNLQLANSKLLDQEEGFRTLASQDHQSLLKVDAEKRALVERLNISDTALRRLHQEHAKLVSHLKSMQNIQVPSSSPQEKLLNSFLESERPSDTTSPDLGIDSGHDGAANSDDSHGTLNVKIENRELRRQNKEMALKLKNTRQILQNTIDKLHSTARQKEEVEKAICRQLHKTHTILRQAKKSVEKYTDDNNQNQNHHHHYHQEKENTNFHHPPSSSRGKDIPPPPPLALLAQHF